MAMERKNLPEVMPELFEHEEFGQFRFIKQGEELWFVAVDVCRALDIQNPRDVVAKQLDDDEKADVDIIYTSSNGVTQRRKVNIVSEPGLYRLIFMSRKPEAKKFKRWVTHEVLPSIRKYGYYSMTQKNLQEPLILFSGEFDPKLVEPGYLSPKEFWEIFDKIRAGQFEIKPAVGVLD